MTLHPSDHPRLTQYLMKQSFFPYFFGAGLALLSGCSLKPGEQERGAETAPEGLTSLSAAAMKEDAGPVNFHTIVKPILENKCVACHHGENAAGGFRLDSKERALARGPGGPRIVPGNPDASLVLDFTGTHRTPAIMPVVGDRLTATESKLLRRWIREGATWPAGMAGHLKPGTAALAPETTLWQKK